jgi:hypothetical protein
LFNIPRPIPTEAAKLNVCAHLLFPFSGLDIYPQNLKPVFGCFVLFWGGEPTGLQVKDFYFEMLSSRMGC